MYVCGRRSLAGGVDRENSSEIYVRDSGQNSATHGRDGKQWKPCWTIFLSTNIDWAFLQPHDGSTVCDERCLRGIGRNEGTVNVLIMCD